ncbi:Sodium/hydrogen exchanger family-domain-containing protein [Irpex lacteus]|nr:Sodium/hydrogen exchanger family-domain-containing protein [Irpex lacteus]
MNYISALAVAACLTPTDPIICAAIVGGRYAIKHVPTNLRRILAAESAAKDGMVYPFLSMSIYLTVETSRRGWLSLNEVVIGTLIGTFLGIAFSKLMRSPIDAGTSYVAQYLALALFTIGVASSLGTDDLFAAFAAGSALSCEVFSSAIDLLLNCPCFVSIGPSPPSTPPNSASLIVLLFVILVVRRCLCCIGGYRISGWKEAFLGHFGPMGVGAVFVSTLALSRLPEPHSPPQNQQEYLAATLQTIVAFIVLGSILIHGLSIPFFSFGRRIHSQTVSLTRTLTSRNTTMDNTLPEWLMGTRRMPPYEVSGAGPDPHALATINLARPHPAQDGRVPHFGEASFLEEPPRTRESCLRRRTTGVETLGSPSNETAQENVHGVAPADADADHPQVMPDTLNDENLPMALKARIELVDDNDDDKPPSGVQTPVKAIHFPPSQ